MTTPTVPVTVDLAAMGGPALAGITVRATLDGNEVYTGIVVSKRVEAVTDASGVAILNMFPNAPSPTGLGTQGTTYHITALVPGGRGVSVQARVPNLACRLENILVLDDDEPVDVSTAELALLQAQAAVTVVAAGSAAASASAASASAAATQTTADRVQTGLDRVATAADRVQTGLDRTQTGADRVQTGSDRAAASASALAAASSQAQAAAIVLGAEAPWQLTDYTALRAYAGGAKTIQVTGYLATAAPSGIAGLFTLDDSDTTSADNGGTIIVASSGKRWKRNLTGQIATPEWFGIPLVSSGVDYTTKLQAVLDCRRFSFPAGFQASCKTLYLRSNSVGVFNDAKFTLLDAQPAGTQVMVLGDAGGYKCVNSVFYGGQVDGNRANNTAAGSTTTIAGGDGGMHGIQVHNARGVRWYGPKANNCGTDGILVWQRYAGDTFGATEVADVHFYSPATDGNGRQGISVIACDDMHFYDASVTNTGLGTGAKLPQAGIDIEGNTATDNVGVYFHGRTYCAGNFGRALMTHNQGGVYRITLDDLVCSANNVNGDGQVVMNVAAGSGKNYMKARKVIITGSGTGYGLCDTSFTPTTETPVNSFEIDSVESDAKVIFRDQAVLDIGRIVATGASTTTDNASAMFYNPKGRVGRVEAYNTSGAANGFCLLVAGANRLTIDSAYTSGPRGLYLFDGVSNKTVNDLTIDGALIGSAVRIRNATKNTVSAKLIGTITGERPVVFEGTSDDNQVVFEWEAANTESVLVIGNRNRIKLRSIRAAGDAAITVGATGVDTMIHTSYFKGATGTGHVINTGTGTLVIGSFPKTVNT